MRRRALLVLAVGLLIAADAKNDDAVTKEWKNLTGTYVMVSGESRAEKVSEERIKEATLVLERDKYTAKFGDDAVKGTRRTARERRFSASTNSRTASSRSALHRPARNAPANSVSRPARATSFMSGRKERRIDDSSGATNSDGPLKR